MEQNENQYEEPDRRKIAFLIGGLLVILAALLLVIYLFTDRTNASTGEGDAIRITPERIERISDDVSQRVLDTLSTDLLTDRIRDAVTKELSKDKIYEILSGSDIEVAAIGEEELKDIITVILTDLGISTDRTFTEEQKKYIRLAVDDALAEALAQINLSQPLSPDIQNQIEERLRRELSGMLKTQIQNSTYQLSGQDLEHLKRSLQIEHLVTGAVDQITKQQLETLRANIISSVKKSVKTPVKGVDYFTEADIQSMQAKILKEANKETLKQIEALASRIKEVQTSVSTLTRQVKELQTLDQKQSQDLNKLQASITNINTSIRHINSVTTQLTEAITISSSHLEKVSGSGSDIHATPIAASNLTIAEFVDILAGNDQVYTGAIQQLNKMVKQLKDDNLKQDQAFDKSVKDLEQSLSDNGKDLEDAKAQLQKNDQELKKQLNDQSANLDQKLQDTQKDLETELEKAQKALEDEQKERKEADETLQQQTDDTRTLIGDSKDAEGLEGDTIFQKIGAIINILSKDGISGLIHTLKGIGGAESVEEGMENLHTDLQDARSRVGELEKEKWLSNITLLAEPYQEGSSGYTYQESGSAYVYQIPLVTDADQIALSDDDTAIVIHFTQPGRLPSNAALSTSGNNLLVSFANKPTRRIDITSIHVYKEK
ncbi:MAG: hypothetical protein HFH34_05995 [Eubacterium sp.]|nr:hypothetical protein [Eubacterium sp.]